MIFFVTCGRGFEKFVKEELQKTEDVCVTSVIGEGKILFCQCITYSQVEKARNCKLIYSVDSGRTNNCIADNLPLNICIQEFSFPFKNHSKLTSLFNLKLVEKLYVLLYYKIIKNVEEIENYTNELIEGLFKINYESAMDEIGCHGELNLNNSAAWKRCSNPSKCSAFISRQEERDASLSRKRKYADERNSSVTGGVKTSKLKLNARGKEQHFMRSVDENERVAVTNHDNLIQKTFRVSCRIRGRWKKFLKPYQLSKSITDHILHTNRSWSHVSQKPNLDIYVNLNDDCIIVGASLTEKPLSLRSYIPHITLRSTICHLMIKQAKITEGFTVLDPMCGAGTILLEAAMNVKNLRIIANDNNRRQLNAARCNLRDLKNVDFILSNATRMPLQDSCIEALVCDFPFGRKHSVSSHENLMPNVLKECVRVLQTTSRLVILVSAEQQVFLKEFSSGIPHLTLVGVYPISLGLTPAFIFTFEVVKSNVTVIDE